MNNKKKGIFYIVIAALSFATMGLFVQLSGDVPFIQKTFFRNIVAVSVAFFVIMRKDRNFTFKKENLKFLILRSIFGTAGVFLNFYAIENMILSDATTISKLAPFFVILFSFLILKEKIKTWQLGSIIIAFIGSVFIINPNIFTSMFTAEPFDISFTSTGGLAGLMGAVCAGVAYTFIRRLAIGGERGPFIVFFFSLFSTIVCLPFMIVDFEPMTLVQFAFLLGAGIFASFGQFAVTAAYSNAPAKDISVYDYSQIIFSALYSLLIFGQIPTGYSVVGYVIITVVAIFMFLKEKEAEKPAKT